MLFLHAICNALDPRKGKENPDNLAHQGTGTADGAAWRN